MDGRVELLETAVVALCRFGLDTPLPTFAPSYATHPSPPARRCRPLHRRLRIGRAIGGTTAEQPHREPCARSREPRHDLRGLRRLLHLRERRLAQDGQDSAVVSFVWIVRGAVRS